MSVAEFNTTLFDLIDEMMGIVDASPVLKTAYTVFKGSQQESPVALDAFWDLAKDNEKIVSEKNLKKMADLLKEVVPLPGMVDDVWDKLSEENRDIVGEYIAVLYEIAAKVKSSEEVTAEKKEGSDASLYSIYNKIWTDFLTLCHDQNCAFLEEGVDKFEKVMASKGLSNTMVYAVMLPAMELVLPSTSITSEMDILKLCLPPSNPTKLVKKDIPKFGDALFPFDRKVPFSQILEFLVHLENTDVRDKLASYWHYLKLFTMCIQQCPPEAMGMMNGMVKFVQGSLGP